jgi:hypothetical protein
MVLILRQSDIHRSVMAEAVKQIILAIHLQILALLLCAVSSAEFEEQIPKMDEETTLHLRLLASWLSSKDPSLGCLGRVAGYRRVSCNMLLGISR